MVFVLFLFPSRRVIKMQTTDFYATLPADPTAMATPVYEHDTLEPFGQHIGDEETSWTDFKAGQPDPSLFAVSGVADCPESPNCGNSVRQHRRLRDGDYGAFAKYL